MSVVLEVSVSAEAFQLGRVLAAPESVRIELERVVPLGDASPLYLWASGSQRSQFARSVRSRPAVDEFAALDRQDERTLYRLDWTCEAAGMIAAIKESEAAVVRARSESDWTFQLRFPDEDRLSQFHERCSEADVPIRIERINRSTGEPDLDHRHGLSSAQREALVVALERGYFATPSEVSLQELAAEFDISHQALSSRIRRGLEVVLSDTLQTPVTEEH